jgi:hypothetical protein
MGRLVQGTLLLYCKSLYGCYEESDHRHSTGYRPAAGAAR